MFKRSVGSFITVSFSSWQIATRLSFWSWLNTLGTNFAACSAVLWQFADKIRNQFQPLHRDRVWYDDDPGWQLPVPVPLFEEVVAMLGWPDRSVINSRSSAFLEMSKPLKSSAAAHARITKSLFQHFKSFTSVLPNLTHNLMHTLCSSTSAIPPISENRRQLMQYTHKDTCNNQTLPHPTTPLGTLTHKTPPQHTLAGNSWTTSDLRVMSIVLGLLDTPLY